MQLPPLENPNERAAVGSELQLVLQDLIDLSLVGKQLHWSVVGAAAHGLHLFLDELVGSGASWQMSSLSVRGLDLRPIDQPGFWEMFGYHNYGHPWKEQRYQGD
ncbi:hypothetical protein EV137_7091 [Kribbella pratensis]|uniref:Uncharacterized protein n=1 Tax=Kribbella pratensis TaxID=2512112 RepID=A0ABY2F7C2_9ACTN|nr:hypothetical protein EV137_7091 [Kribbella pratensis]